MVTDDRSNTSLVHHTSQEYLETAKFEHSANADRSILKTYFSDRSWDLVRESCSSDKSLEAKLGKYDFIDYAATAMNRGYHATSRDKNEIQEAVLESFADTTRTSAAAQLLLLPKGRRNTGHGQRVGSDLARSIYALSLA